MSVAAALRDAGSEDEDESRLHIALRAADLGIWDWDLIAGTMTWSRRAKEIYGFPPDEPVTFEMVREATHPEDLPRTSEIARRAQDPSLREKVPYEYRIVRPDGGMRWIQAHGDMRFETADGATRAARYVGTIQDITERRQAEETQRLHALLLENMSEGVCLLDDEGTILHANPAMAQMLGHALDGLVGQRVPLDPDTYPAGGRSVFREIVETVDRGAAWRGEWTSLRADGEPLPTRVRINSIDVGGARRLLCTQHDLTDVLRTEAERRSSEARLRLALDAGRLAIWDYDAATDAISGSPKLYELLGFEPGHSPTTDEIRSRYLPGEQERVAVVAMAALERGERYFESEFRYVCPDGQVRWLLLRAEVIIDGASVPSSVLGVVMDLTESKRTQEALARSEQRLALALEAHRVGIFDWDIRSGRLEWTKQQEELAGLAAGEFDGTIDQWLRRVHPDDRRKMHDLIQKAFAAREEDASFEFRILLPDNSVRHIEGSQRIIYDASGAPERAVGVNIDVTDRKRAEEQQDVLIRELNHRVKNMLAVVQAIASQSLRNAPDLDSARRSFNSRLGALAIAHDALTRGNWSISYLDELVPAVLTPHRDEQNDQFRIEGPRIPVSPQSSVSLAMVLHELSTNAMKYGALSRPGGRVSVTWRQDMEGGEVRLELRWLEEGAGPLGTPQRKGFGSRLIERGWAVGRQNKVEIEYRTGGLVCTFVATTAFEAGAGPVEW